MGKSDGRNRLCLTIGQSVAILFRFQRPHFGFQSGDAISLHLDRFHQAIDDGVQIMIARVGKAYRQLSRSPAHKVEFWFVREHVFALRLALQKSNYELFDRRRLAAESGVGRRD